jgi:hypothetical protein
MAGAIISITGFKIVFGSWRETTGTGCILDKKLINTLCIACLVLAAWSCSSTPDVNPAGDGEEQEQLINTPENCAEACARMKECMTESSGGDMDTSSCPDDCEAERYGWNFASCVLDAQCAQEPIAQCLKEIPPGSIPPAKNITP